MSDPNADGFDRTAFDADWYLKAYPDVAQAQIDPWRHYSSVGWREGRLPAPVQALGLDRWLWIGEPDAPLIRLHQLCDHPPTNSPIERAGAAWVLARWYASQGDWPSAQRYIALFHALGAPGRKAVAHIGPFLLAGQVAARCGSPNEVQHWIDRTLVTFGPRLELDLLAIERGWMRGGREADGEAALRELYTRQGLSPVFLRPGPGSRFDRLSGVSTEDRRQIMGADEMPLISVIMPVYNAAATLDVAISSVLAQDWHGLELLIVDDGSSDESLQLAHGAAQRDKRVRVIETGTNIGTYCARNLGLNAANGQFVTVHDADDWSHPSKLRKQVLALLEHPELQATVSHWVRADESLTMSRWRMEPEGWVHRNVSSLMFRREMRDHLGFWDRVRFNADTEYYYRLIAAFGPSAIGEICSGIPLAWGRTTTQSLTSQATSHARTHVWGVRRSYMEAAHFWHSKASESGLPYLCDQPVKRPFRVLAELGAADEPGPKTEFDLLTESGWFDPAWYVDAYPDVLDSGLGPERHFLLFGWKEDRDPGPEFSSSGYRLKENIPSDTPALLHWISRHGSRGDDSPPHVIVFPGHNTSPAQRHRKPGWLARVLGVGPASPQPVRPMIFGHAASKTMFGAERSFMSMVKAMHDRGETPIVVLPAARDPAYLERLCELSEAVIVVPQIWRRAGRNTETRTVEILRGLIRQYRVNQVHVNTLVMEAPLIAARAEGCKSVVHVRELPEQDPALCRAMGFAPDELRELLLKQADLFVANSPLVAAWLNCPDRVEIVPNRVDPDLFALDYSPGSVLRIGLVSSNIVKKGIEDAATVAYLLALRGIPIPAEIRLIGPETVDLQRVMSTAPESLKAVGYVEDPVKAMAQLDLVMSLSHFAESFGRTVLEAMAAGRPVICYDRGMPPNLVRAEVDGTEVGIVVPPDNPEAVAEAIEALVADPARLQRMSAAARERARRLNEPLK